MPRRTAVQRLLVLRNYLLDYSVAIFTAYVWRLSSLVGSFPKLTNDTLVGIESLIYIFRKVDIG